MLLKMNFGQLWTYPFEAGVWGTVSDWVVILITAITGWLIYLTLKSQKKVQQDQYNLLKIESERFREESKPTFDVSHQPSVSISEGWSEKDFPSLIFQLKENVAKNIEITIKDEGHYSIESLSGTMDCLYKGDGILVFLKPKEINKSVSQTKICRFILTFSDRYDVRYRQEVFFMYNDVPIISVTTTMIN